LTLRVCRFACSEKTKKEGFIALLALAKWVMTDNNQMLLVHSGNYRKLDDMWLSDVMVTGGGFGGSPAFVEA
jgi:hypothetical protein